MRYLVTAREEIIAASGKPLDDDGMRALDSSSCFIVEVQDNLSLFDQLDESLDKFELSHPCCRHRTYTISPAS